MGHVRNLVGGIALSMLTGMNVYTTVENMMSYNQLRNAVIQRRINEAPELSDKVFESITKEVAEKVPRERLYFGLMTSLIAGLTTAGAVVNFANAYSSRKDDD